MARESSRWSAKKEVAKTRLYGKFDHDLRSAFTFFPEICVCSTFFSMVRRSRARMRFAFVTQSANAAPNSAFLRTASIS
jgi:hypothetical protein